MSALHIYQRSVFKLFSVINQLSLLKFLGLQQITDSNFKTLILIYLIYPSPLNHQCNYFAESRISRRYDWSIVGAAPDVLNYNKRDWADKIIIFATFFCKLRLILFYLFSAYYYYLLAVYPFSARAEIKIAIVKKPQLNWF